MNQSYYRVDDSVFICEQQFMGVLIQTPLAVGRDVFAQLSESNFTVPVFRSLFQAVLAAGGLPVEGTPQGLWMHDLSKAAGPVLEPVVNELAVMQLPLSNGGADGSADGVNAGSPLHRPTDAERQYAAELSVRLLDLGYMRDIARARRRMSQMPEGEQKFGLLGEITRLEASRKNLQAEVYGNTVG